MLALLNKVLAAWRSNPSDQCAQAPLFSGSAYFSNRVPGPIIETWVSHGGQVSSGTTLDPRARYFFAMDPSEKWVTKLFAKSVTVIHAGWIVHCVEETFRVPISQYILDDRFIPGPPYKLTGSLPRVTVPVASEFPANPEYEKHEPAPTSLTLSSGGRSSDTPSTPPKIPLKRKREQAYYDSPSGSLVFSGFDKDGIPRRPRKQRKLRFDPSFSPQNGRRASRKDEEGKRRNSVDWVEDFLETFGDDDESVVGEVSQESVSSMLERRGGVSSARSPDTPNKPFDHNGSPSYPRRSIAAERVSKPFLSPCQIISETPVQVQVNHPFDESPSNRVCTIDFTNLPPSTHRWRFQASKDSFMTFQNSISTVKPETIDEKPEVKTPKKISFAEHAQVRVYTVSPPPESDATSFKKEKLDPMASDEKVGATPTKVGFADRARVRVYAADSSPPRLDANEAVTEVQGYEAVTRGTAEGKMEAPRFDAEIGGSVDPTQTPVTRPATGRSEDDATGLTVTLEDVQATRRRLIELDAKNGAGDGQLATVFEIGKPFRGTTFRHVR